MSSRGCATTSTAGRWPPRWNASGSGAGWRCVDVGAGGGDVSVALAEMVGRDGRVYAVDSDPAARDEVARAAAAHAQVIALTQAGEDLSLPEEVDLAFCRFLLLHVHEPLAVVVRMMAAAVRPAAGWWRRSRSPRRGASRAPLSMPDARHPDVGALLPALVRDAGLEVIDAWAEAPAGVGPGAGRRATWSRSPGSIRARTRSSCRRWSP